MHDSLCHSALFNFIFSFIHFIHLLSCLSLPYISSKSKSHKYTLLSYIFHYNVFLVFMVKMLSLNCKILRRYKEYVLSLICISLSLSSSCFSFKIISKFYDFVLFFSTIDDVVVVFFLFSSAVVFALLSLHLLRSHTKTIIRFCTFNNNMNVLSVPYRNNEAIEDG